MQKSSHFTKIITKEDLPFALWPPSFWWYLSHSYNEAEKIKYIRIDGKLWKIWLSSPIYKNISHWKSLKINLQTSGERKCQMEFFLHPVNIEIITKLRFFTKLKLWNTVAFTCDFKSFTGRGLVNISKNLNIRCTFDQVASQDCALSCWASFLSGAYKVNLALSVGTVNCTAHISDNETI